MPGLDAELGYLLSAMGLAILVVWPEHGPGACVRDKVFRRVLPKSLHGVLDCYICFGFWSGLAMSILWWTIYRRPWIWFGCLMTPAAFWLVMGKWKD